MSLAMTAWADDARVMAGYLGAMSARRLSSASAAIGTDVAGFSWKLRRRFGPQRPSPMMPIFTMRTRPSHAECVGDRSIVWAADRERAGALAVEGHAVESAS